MQLPDARNDIAYRGDLLSPASAAGRQPDWDQLFASEVAAKRLELLRAMVPAAERVTALVDPGCCVSVTAIVENERAAHFPLEWGGKLMRNVGSCSA